MLFKKHPIIFPKQPDLPVLATAVGCQRIMDSSYYYHGKSKGKNWSLIQITLSGSGRLKVGNETHRLDSGKAMVINFPSSCEYYWEQELDGEQKAQAWDFVYINLIGREAKRVCSELVQTHGNCIDIQSNPSILLLLEQLIEDCEANKIKDPFSLSNKCYSLLMELEKFKHHAPQENYPEHLQKAIRYVHVNLEKHINVQDLADHVSYSRFHLSRSFKSYLNLSPLEYINRIKMEHAVNLLKDGSNVNDVAEQLSYDDVSYFCKVFKRHFNISPGKFSKSHLYQISESNT